MKIEGYRCRCSPGTVHGRDHYQEGAAGCPDPPFPVEWIDEMVAAQEGDDLHREGRITATRLLGCPRQSILLDAKPVALDLRRIHAGSAGTMWHATMERRGRPGYRYEVRMPETRLIGVTVTGKVDRVRDDWSEILDWKTHGESSMGAKWGEFQSKRVNWEVAAQLNLYRLMIARSVLKVPDENYQPALFAWHMGMVKASPGPGEPPPAPRRGGAPPKPPCPPAFKVRMPIMSEVDIARLRPFDDADSPGTQPYSVAEIAQMYVEFKRKIESGMPFDVALKSTVPLIGRAVWGGTMCTRYCAALELCDEVEGVQRGRA